MFAWLIYFGRMFAAVILGGAAAAMGIASTIDPKSRLGMLGIAGVFAFAALFTWPRRPDAWRRDPPTERQLAYAESLGIVVPRGASKGEVSEMISAVTGR